MSENSWSYGAQGQDGGLYKTTGAFVVEHVTIAQIETTTPAPFI